VLETFLLTKKQASPLPYRWTPRSASVYESMHHPTL